MKKLGVVTWHKNGNYGGTLQAYALMKTLQKFNYDVEFINYDRTNGILREIRNIAFHILFPKSALSRDRIYRFVNKEFQQSPKLSKNDEIKAYSEKYEAVICGSDQIWSSLNGVDPVYFLQFVPINKRIAYAPSIGVPNIPASYLDDFIKYVKTIPWLSIREKQGVDYIKLIAGVEPKLVLDPTFLLEGEEWKALSSNKILLQNNMVSQKYILCYFLGDDDKYTSYVSNISKKASMPVYYVSSKRKNYKEKQLVCDPFEFVGLLNNAAYVITDSFHGMALSVNLGVRVGVFERFHQDDVINQNSRINNIIELFNCKEILIHPDESPEKLLEQKQLSNMALDKIQELREESLNYLLKATKEIWRGK